MEIRPRSRVNTFVRRVWTVGVAGSCGQTSLAPVNTSPRCSVRSQVMAEVNDTGVHAAKFLSAFLSWESLPTPQANGLGWA